MERHGAAHVDAIPAIRQKNTRVVDFVVSEGLLEERQRAKYGAFPAAIRPVEKIDLSEGEVSGCDETPKIVESQAGDHWSAVGVEDKGI